MTSPSDFIEVTRNLVTFTREALPRGKKLLRGMQKGTFTPGENLTGRILPGGKTFTEVLLLRAQTGLE